MASPARSLVGSDREDLPTESSARGASTTISSARPSGSRASPALPASGEPSRAARGKQPAAATPTEEEGNPSESTAPRSIAALNSKLDKRFEESRKNFASLGDSIRKLLDQIDARFAEQQSVVAGEIDTLRGDLDHRFTALEGRVGSLERAPGGHSQQAPGHRSPPADRPTERADFEARRVREATHGSTTSAASATTTVKIKREDIGQFDPYHDDPRDVGLVTDGKAIIYTDVILFRNRIETFLEEASTSVEAERQIMVLLPTLLSGAAILWWSNELPTRSRMSLRSEGLAAILEALETRFAPDIASATKRFNEGELRVKHIAEDENALTHFVQRQMRYARAMQILSKDTSNWIGAMSQSWSRMDLVIRRYIRAPDPKESLGDYMQYLDQQRAILLAAAHDRYPHLAKAPQSSAKSSSKADGKSSSRKPSPERPRDSRPQDQRYRYESRHRYVPRHRDDHHDENRYRDDRRHENRHREDRHSNGRREDRHRDRDRDRDRHRKDDRDHRYRDHAHFADGADKSSSEADHSDSSVSSRLTSSDSDIACLVLETSKTCHKCHQTFDSVSLARAHLEICSKKAIPRSVRLNRRNQVDPARRTCGYCQSVCESRNALFRHLKFCEDAKNGSIRRPLTPFNAQSAEPQEGDWETNSATESSVSRLPESASAFQIKEAPEPAEKDSVSPLSGYTHLRVKARAAPDAADVEICMDPGAGRAIIGRNFLNTLEHKIERRKGKVKGVNGSPVSVSQWATFSWYFPGEENGKPTLMKFTRSAWVLDYLEPNLLLGNDLMDQYQCDIDYGSKKVKFQALDGFAISFEIRTRAFPCRRQVKTRRAITLLPGQEAFVPVDYKPLPEGRDFAFRSRHAAVYHAVIHAKTPKVVAVRNPTEGVMTIPKRYPVGRIEECEDSGYFACSWTNAFTALTVGTAFAAMATPAAAADIDAGVLVAEASMPSLSAEFAINNATRSIINHGAQSFSVAAQPPVSRYENHASTTPLSDYVFQLTQQSVSPPADPEPAKPRVPEKHSTLGLRMGLDLPELVTKDGIHVYAADPKLARKFVALVEEFPRMWTDQGLIDVPPDQLLKVPLVEGWQHQRIKARSYPLSRRDREVLDKTFGELHRQGKMTWATEATPFAHPVFVVWRTVKGEQKGRVVIDLRALNRVTVPDNYPLPLQAEIIGCLRGKKFITVIDATSFFYQFGVYPPHRNRFTLISPRGLEQPTVALMGYRNSPAYVQRFMDRLLQGRAHFCRAFIDDIVIFSDTAEDHLRHLRDIFRLFTSKNIAISPAKSYIGYPNVELLGFRVDNLGLTTTAHRVAAFKNLAFPASLKALEQYIGATGFLRHLIPYFAKLVEPLQERKTALLAAGRKSGQLVAGNPGKRTAYCARTHFEPTEAEKASFAAIQEAICKEHPTILHHFNPDKQLFLQIDGCLERGFGVMAFHLEDGYEWTPGSPIPANKVKPVMFLSRALQKAEMRYGPSEQEVACLVWAVRKLRTTIHSSCLPVIVLTDHSATKGIVEQTNLDTSSTDRANRRLINASIYLSQYDLKVYHLPGRLNYVPDALSRLAALQDPPERGNGDAILDNVWFAWAEAKMDDDLRQEFVKGYQEDTKYAAIIKDLRPTEGSGDTFSRRGLPFVLVDGLLYNVRPDGTRALCIPHSQVKSILSVAHDDKHHFREDRMLHDLRGVAITNKTYQVKKYIKYCPACGLLATDRQPPIGEAQPIRPQDTLPMRVIAIDFILALPAVPSEGSPWQIKDHKEFNAMMTVSCKASKRTLLIPGHSTYSAEDWGTTLLRQLLLSDWGVPSAIISDRDRKFTSDLWQGMWKALGTRLMMTAAYHPQADGLAERKNQTVEIALRFYIFERPDSSWLDIIPLLQWNLNSGYSAPINSSPHEQLYGFRPAGPLEALLPQATTATQAPVLREFLRQDAQLAMDFAAARAKRRYDQHHRAMEFKEGDKVYLRLHRGYHLPGNPSRKLSQQRSGPWVIKRRIGRLAYELDFPPNFGIHPVISVAHLSPTPPGEDPFGRDAPPPGPVEESQSRSSDDDEPGEDYEVEAVVDHKKLPSGAYKYLIKWTRYGNEHNEWKTAYQLRHAARLVSEYWARKGGQPSDTEAPAEPRRHGRPKRNPVANKPAEPPRHGRPRKNAVADEPGAPRRCSGRLQKNTGAEPSA